jgi:KTSC domain-containing protein
MHRQHVDSTGVLSVGYDDWTKTLEIEYAGGAVYDYSQVPEVLYRDLLAASSKRQFVDLYIKPYFEYEKIEGDKPVTYIGSGERGDRRSMRSKLRGMRITHRAGRSRRHAR